MSGCFVCCSCISDKPLDDDPRKDYTTKWQVDMGQAPLEAPGTFLFSIICCPCAQYSLRKRALGGTLDEYTCCQSYFSLCCCEPGNMGEKSNPELCLCLETCCCLSCAVSATRMYIMDKYNLHSDPCDNRIIRFNNFMQLLSCVISLLSICIGELRDAAVAIEVIARVVFLCTVGCMTVQQNKELDYQASLAERAGGGGPPPIQEGMDREMVQQQPPPPPPYGQQQQPPYGQQQQGHVVQATPYQENQQGSFIVDAKPVQAIATI